MGTVVSSSNYAPPPPFPILPQESLPSEQTIYCGCQRMKTRWANHQKGTPFPEVFSLAAALFLQQFGGVQIEE